VTKMNLILANAGKVCLALCTGGWLNWDWPSLLLRGGFLLNATGFDQAKQLGQAPETLLWMRIFDIAIPIVTSIIALFIIATIDDSEEKANEVRKQLEARRGKA